MENERSCRIFAVANKPLSLMNHSFTLDAVICCQYDEDAQRIRKTLEKFKLQVNEWTKQIRNERPLKEIWKTLKSKMRGHIQYYGVSHNAKKVNQFIYGTRRIMFKWLNRRSQRRSFSWDKFELFITANPLPTAKTVHKMF